MRRRTHAAESWGGHRHRLARKCFHGQRRELWQRYREGQEDQLGTLGLPVNMLVLWNTRYMDAALSHVRSQVTEVKPDDVARLSSLADKHFNVPGRYHFSVTDSILRGELRPLRDPGASEELLWAAEAIDRAALQPIWHDPDGYLNYTPDGRMYSIVVMENRPSQRNADPTRRK
jgi:Tn3 transposase DDE domain